MSICVVNASNPDDPSKNDSYINFEGYNTYEDGKWRSLHSWAACLGTEFFPYNGENFNKCYKYDNVIVLVDNDFGKLLPFLKKLKMAKKKVALCYHEGIHITDNADFMDILRLKELVDNYADAYIDYNIAGFDFYENLFEKTPVYYIPTSFPIDLWKLDVTYDRAGILIGTRTLAQNRLKRNTMMALASALDAASLYNETVTYVNEDTPEAEKYLYDLFRHYDNLKIIQRKDKYTDWLDLIAQHKAVFQLDESKSFGQVVADALLADTPPVGGNNDVQKLISSEDKNPKRLLIDCLDGYWNWEGVDSKIKYVFGFNRVKNKLENMFYEVRTYD